MKTLTGLLMAILVITAAADWRFRGPEPVAAPDHSLSQSFCGRGREFFQLDDEWWLGLSGKYAICQWAVGWRSEEWALQCWFLRQRQSCKDLSPAAAAWVDWRVMQLHSHVYKSNAPSLRACGKKIEVGK